MLLRFLWNLLLHGLFGRDDSADFEGYTPIYRPSVPTYDEKECAT